MGAGASNPVAQAAAKQKASATMNQAKDGLKSITGGKTEKEKEAADRNKDRASEYEEKKKEREERKKKLAEQRAAHAKR